jgi:glycosyl transferase family 25
MACAVYLINLDRAPARRVTMERQLNALGMSFERIQAVDGKDLSEVERAAYSHLPGQGQQYHRPLSPGEIGCYASHLKIWQRMVEQQLPVALVLEDDMTLAPELPRVMAQALALPLVAWDMIKLKGRAIEKVHQSWSLAEGGTLIRHRRVPSGTGAYLLTLGGAIKLTQVRQRFSRPVDVDLRHWWECDLQLFGIIPYPVRTGEESLRSTIGDQADDAGWPSRWRRMRQQWRYSVRNLSALRAWEPHPALRSLHDPSRAA